MTSTPPRKPGRPATGETPKRNIRVGQVWDDAARIAEQHGETMTVLVARLLDNYVRRHRAELAPAPAAVPEQRTPYGRDKPVVVADSLDQLAGPTTGTITLPHHLDWSGSPTYDLDDPRRLTTLYRTVLQGAHTTDDLVVLNADRLVAEWPDIFLPPLVRQAWEQRFPGLAATRAER